ncbi:flavodoxin domain-containing protein [Desnuesiella massiliensis]|uniref:flavodoxin domain-containing protein n=1 Tax=Desnuesiella massiliensis TaxID=1650662 RepID=UPI0006E37A12|nr:flavodoxin domain-containing protein [Desnuesiella massiliensis]
MSTLIAYATKYGFTKTCAEMLAKKLDEKTDICDLSSDRPNLAQYDKVIIGGSIYAGRIRKPVARFCMENLNALKSKKLGFFICGMADGDDAQKQLESSFPRELLSSAVAKESFGGEYDFKKMNFLERFIIKRISGSDKNQCRIMKENITRFVDQMKNG